eukprot:FR743148.1.p1 GENE.FR743148.1~~FR743148.1.p1  ORF type:complete len:163 (+),score=12.97 FR743148.1:22-489(+)
MTLVKKETCLHATSIATCGAAPCYKNHAAEEHGMVETYTCICPIFPYYANDQVFEFSPDDVGHGGGMRCEAYNADSGTCSINGDSTPTGDIASNISGTALTEWANARVLDFSAASRKEDMGGCRATIYQTKYSVDEEEYRYGNQHFEDEGGGTGI